MYQSGSMKRALLLTALAACGSFEDEDIVIDTRVLAMSATVPDQVIDVDLENPQPGVELLDQIVPTRMCALVADPGTTRRLRWSMTLCTLNSDERCYGPKTLLAEGMAEDPEITTDAAAIEMCATVNPDGNLLGVVMFAFMEAELGGIGGVDYGIGFTVGGEDVDPALDLFAGKTLRVAPRIPAERTANKNPDLDHIDIAIDGADPVPLPLGRCINQPTKLEVKAGVKSRITPVESATTRETYVVPTLDGQSQAFTEAPTYQFTAGAGGFSSGSTGGPRDIAGNPAPLFTDWRAPKPDDVGSGIDVPLWIVQRDERLGATWYESCVRVVP
jgi:hypothetical protein